MKKDGKEAKKEGKAVKVPTTKKARQEAMLAALEKSLGVVSTASRLCGITRKTHYLWMREDPKYKAQVDDMAEVALDFAESQLHKNMQKGSDAAVIFFLKTKGKKRGYVEQQNFNLRVREMNHKTVLKLNDKESPYDE